MRNRRRLRSDAFPSGTALHAFFGWNEARWRPDRRYVIARRLYRLLACVEQDQAVVALAGFIGEEPGSPAVATALDLCRTLLAAIGSPRATEHAAVFAGFEALAERVDLRSLAGWRARPRRCSVPKRPRNLLVIKLGALGDFVQALGPAAAIRRRHAADRVILLTTRPFAELAAETALFDEIIVDDRPKLWEIRRGLRLMAQLRAGRFDRVYDLQTSGRSSAYAFLFGLRRRPEWSGIAWRCSHPHANRDRDPQHTIDKQAEQLLMAGIHPTPLPALPPSTHELPHALQGHDFVILVPGSSPYRPEKRWPAAHFGKLAKAVDRAGFVPVVVGTAEERALATEICQACPDALDLVGRTGLGELTALAQAAALTIGNDTGVCHIAAAAGTPVIVLFSAASDPARCAPRGRSVRVLAVLDLGQLASETVITEAVDLLGNSKATAAQGYAAAPSAQS